MARPDMYRKLPWLGGNPREVAEVVNNLVEGKSNNTGFLTLDTGWATSTTLFDERIGNNSVILFAPSSDSAEADTAPYGEFTSTTQQLAPSAGNTAVVTWDTEHEVNGVYIDVSNDSRLYVRNGGIYDVVFSLQLANANNDAEYADVWFRVNGNDIATSGRRFGLPARKSTGDPSHVTGTANHVLDLNAGDYIEIAGATSSTDVSLETFAATTTTPYTRPAISAAQATVTYTAPYSMDNLYVSSQQKGQATVSHFANNTSGKEYKYAIIG
jgi:hypothetical protein